jgi:hypothetical protein
MLRFPCWADATLPSLLLLLGLLLLLVGWDHDGPTQWLVLLLLLLLLLPSLRPQLAVAPT